MVVADNTFTVHCFLKLFEANNAIFVKVSVGNHPLYLSVREFVTEHHLFDCRKGGTCATI